jgi:hypothetical protein
VTATPPYPSSAGYPGPGGPYAPPPPRRSRKLLGCGVIVAIVLAAAALAIGIVLLARPTPTPPATSPAPATASTTPAGSTTDADRALCTAIAPLMGETDRITNAWVDLGKPGTPARDAATPKFITATQDWIRRIQPILDQNPDIDPFLQRSLQRFIDDQHLMVVDLVPGPLSSHARALYEDGSGAYGGPLHLCDRLGVKW